VNLFTGGGCLIKILGGIVGLAVCGLAMALGLKDVRAGGAACIAGGATIMFLARRDPRHRDGRLGAWGLLAAAAGIATFIWPVWFNERSRVSTHTSTVNDRLTASQTSGTNPLAESKAGPCRDAVIEFERQASLQGQGRVNVFIELDAPEAKAGRKASVYVETEALRNYGPDRKKALALLLIKRLQSDFPQAACNAAARGPFQWGMKASSPAPGQAPTITLDSEKPAF
jgi:hypothetical protein